MHRFVLLLCCLLVLPLKLLAAEITPHQQVDDVTKKLIALIGEARAYYDKEPDRYFNSVEALLDPLIDFPSFTRSVMGGYGTREYYQSLPDAAARNEYRASYDRFVESFKHGLVSTYAKGMLAFNGQTIVVVPPTEDELKLISKKEPVDVVQRITSGADNYSIVYKMRPNNKGEWLVRNVIIESVNVGQLYRNQFASAMDKHKQNFAAVVDNWVVVDTDKVDVKTLSQDDADI